MTAIKTLTALAAGTLAITAAGVVHAQTPYGGYGQSQGPSGSFTSSCRNVETLQNGYVSAECQADGGFRWSAIRHVDCRGDITNRDGVLTCYGATASVGPFYPGQGGDIPYSGPVSGPAQPTGIVGALLGALFGDVFGTDQRLEDDWGRGRRPLYERRQAFDTRIAAGVRDGSLTRGEADRLRSEFSDLVRLESRYAADGRLTTQERADLRSRYRTLSQRIGDERNDDQGNDRWQPLAERRAEFDRRIDAGVRNRSLTRIEATRLRSDFDQLIRVELQYSADGRISAQEYADLDRRYDELSRRIRDERRDDRWDPLAGQRADFNARIDAALRARNITRREATSLRSEFAVLVRLEADYSRDGLSNREQEDLRTRYADLRRRLGDTDYDDGYDDDQGDGYDDGPNGVAADIEARIVTGERSGAISRNEAARLRTELEDLTRLEAAYASDGLNAAERAYMARRYAELSARVRASR